MKKKTINLAKALDILVSYNVPEHIIAHSYKVTKVAYILSNELFYAGIEHNKELVLYSAILHDITKYDAILNKNEDHSETGAIFMKKLGYPEIAEVINSHIVIKNKEKFLIEKKVVFYSDKRVKHDKVVSLKERYDDLILRYGNKKNSEMLIKNGFKKALLIEKELFYHLNITPDYFNIL